MADTFAWQIHKLRKGLWALFLDCTFRVLIGRAGNGVVILNFVPFSLRPTCPLPNCVQWLQCRSTMNQVCRPSLSHSRYSLGMDRPAHRAGFRTRGYWTWQSGIGNLRWMSQHCHMSKGEVRKITCVSCWRWLEPVDWRCEQLCYTLLILGGLHWLQQWIKIILFWQVVKQTRYTVPIVTVE